MPMTLEQVVEEVTRWPDDAVAELIDRVMLAKHGGMEQVVEQAWHGEVSRRIDDIRSGREKGIPGEEVSARIRRIVGR